MMISFYFCISIWVSFEDGGGGMEIYVVVGLFCAVKYYFADLPRQWSICTCFSGNEAANYRCILFCISNLLVMKTF